jgi:Mrp family chromosome partitioning ATPase/capsular polysaccharide biosynthesis protein
MAALSPTETHGTLTPQRVVKVLWRRKLVCLLVAGVVLIAGAAYLITRPKVYESTSSVALLPVANNASVLSNYPNIIASLIPTYVELVSSPVLLNRVAPTLPFKISGNQLANDVHGESLSNAAVINIVGINSNPVRAQQIATATTASFLAHVQGNGVVTAQIYGRPMVPDRPASPRTKLLLPVILLLAVFVGMAAGLAWDRLFGHPEAAGEHAETAARLPSHPEAAGEHAETAAQPPVLGIVRKPGVQGGVSFRDGPGMMAAQDGWWSLGTNFMYAMLGQQMHSVTIMSPAPGASTYAVAAILAATVAEMGMAVVLVDADLHRSRLHELFSLDNGQGLTSTILDEADPATLLRPVPDVAGLQVITAGPPLPPAHKNRNAANLYREQLPRLMSLADLVIVAGPSPQSDVEAQLVAGVTDGVVLVIGSGALNGNQFGATLHHLTSCGTRVLGTVLTGIGGPPDVGEPEGPQPDGAGESTQPIAKL